MKTRIIQQDLERDADEGGPVVTAATDGNTTLLRRAFLFLGIAGYLVIGFVHPDDLKVGDETTLYLWIHLIQPVLVLFLAWGVWLLVRDVPGRAAQVARVAIVPYAIAYAAFDAVAGIAAGMIIREANRMSSAEGAAVQRVWDDADRVTDAVSLGVYTAAALAWFVMALAAAIAVKQLGGLWPTLLMAVGAAIFAVGHPFPPGPIGIGLFGLGIVWLELRREPAAAPETQPALAP